MAKEKKITIVNTGLSAIYINRVRLMPDDEIEIEEAELNTSGVEYLIHRGEISVKNNKALNEEVKGRVAKKVKKDPFEGKSQKELEDGGEY